jgi:hypothetical protein
MGRGRGAIRFFAGFLAESIVSKRHVLKMPMMGHEYPGVDGYPESLGVFFQPQI